MYMAVFQIYKFEILKQQSVSAISDCVGDGIIDVI